MVDELGLGGIPRDVGQFSPYRSPGHSERTRRAGGACKGERSGDRQHLTPGKGRASDEEGREEKAARGTPRRKARKRQLIKPATALGQHEEPGKCDPCNEAECTEQEREREVGIEAKHPTRHEAHSEQGRCPGEAHPDCTANASQPLPHDRLRPWRRAPPQPLPSVEHRALCTAKYQFGRRDSRALVASLTGPWRAERVTIRAPATPNVR